MRPKPEATREKRIGWLGSAVVAVAIGVTAAAAMQPSVIGQFHDDGVYVAVAKSVAEGEGYRHASLPGNPIQTKYPPLYATFLSGIWKLAPAFPANIVWFKLGSIAFLSLSVFLAGAFAVRRIGGTVAPGAFAYLVGANPLVFPFGDYAVTELPFLTLCLAAFCLAPRPVEERHRAGPAGTSGPPGAEPGAGVRRALLLGTVCGLAMLVRQAALPLVLAGGLCYGTRKSWKALAAFAVPVVLLVAPWLWFKASNFVVAANPVLAYYVTYEPSVLQLALTDPALAGRIVFANLVYLWAAVDLAAYLSYFPVARILLYPVIAAGLWRLLRRPLDFVTVFAVLYGALIVLWPWHPSRYAIPLAPLVPFALFLAGRWIQRRLRVADGTARLQAVAQRALPWAPVALATIMGASWLASYVPKDEETTRAAFIARLEYSWSGFEETARWIRENTETDAILATAYDPLYYLYAGRRGVRPWLHRPWTYFYPLGDEDVDVGSAAEIRPSLEELGVRYLVIDPLDGYQEEDAAGELFEDLLDSYRGPGHAGPPRLRFTSSDGLHRVYELPRRGTPGATDGPPD